MLLQMNELKLGTERKEEEEWESSGRLSIIRITAFPNKISSLMSNYDWA